ncbi:N-acetylmuramoyl-L-alanine amidase [Roseomonas elaeocarpi]|uniref:N-acetylmuramoyl-L-alanine amidase n=1 Tax=Roseomonas elaeocarpi TaxID=907779 RepID=A0ABV6JXX3_9PROT
MSDHLFIRDLLSPNQDDRPADTPVDTLILHYTDMESGAAAIERLRDPVARVSSHYVVEEDGAIFRLVPEHRRAFHAGVSHWRGHETLNGRSIGIEVVNPGHSCGYRPFPALQMAALCELCLDILGRWPIPARNVVAHSDVAPDRKRDPGELFDWEGLAANGVGLWPFGISGNSLAAVPGGAEQAVPLLRAIGYPVDEARPEIAVTAFQRHWRQEAVSGESDAGTLARLRAVATLCRELTSDAPNGLPGSGPGGDPDSSQVA